MKESKMIEVMRKTRDYLDYIEEHYNNVQTAWKLIQEKCKNMRFVYDDFVWGSIETSIKEHDLSKLSKEEFVQYRQFFFSLQGESKNKDQFMGAWEHHKKNNAHHWQNWTKKETSDPYSLEIYCVEMVVDWIAMGMKMGDSARDYYASNKDEIKLPIWADRFVNEIFDAVYEDRSKGE